MKLTAAEIRALQAVKDGKVFRRYGSEGNVLKSEAGNSSRVLWSLHRKGLIGDGEGITTRTYHIVLTKTGLAIIANNHEIEGN